MDYVLLEGDSLQVLKELDDNSVDSVVTDPPYGIKFMGKKWDHSVPSVELWKEVYRVLKAGGHMLVACGTRTQHRMVVNIEDAGFEIRDVITWHYGSGFPKSMDISKAIDKQAGVEREVVGKKVNYHSEGKRAGTGLNMHGINDGSFSNPEDAANITAPATPEAKQWEGWGTALKPATEFWTLCRKPLSESTVADNVIKHGTGGLNIDVCRIETEDKLGGGSQKAATFKDKEGWDRNWMHDEEAVKNYTDRINANVTKAEELGRFPSNLILDEYAAELLDEQSGVLKSGTLKGNEYLKGKVQQNTFGSHKGHESIKREGDSGGASRFFYVAKASKKERSLGLEGTGLTNNHPTVKPLKLMQYLIKMITPKGGLVLDPFNGSGTTGCACAIEDFDYIGIDKNDEGVECIKITEARIEHWKKNKN